MAGADCYTPKSAREERGGVMAAGNLCAPTPSHVEVHIHKVENGFCVIIGCKTFVSKDWTEVATALGEYWNDPEMAQKKWCK